MIIYMIGENDNNFLLEGRKLPNTPEEIAEVQSKIEKSFTSADHLRTLAGKPPLSRQYRIERYRKLNIPIPDKYKLKDV